MSSRKTSTESALAEPLARLAAFIRREQVILTIALVSFVARLPLASMKSYWLDEVLSVRVYGVENDSFLAALALLAERSVHPPLYQAVLYPWMQLFGTSEVATRSLSNLYISVATIVVYLMMRDLFSRRAALLAAVVFALTYSSTYYATEARSYAQTVMLASITSWLLLRLVRRLTAGATVRQLATSPAGIAFTLASSGLLLTHYYNVFLWAAQAAFALLWVLRDAPRRGPASLGVVGAYAVQVMVFLTIWGWVIPGTLDRFSGDSFDVNDRPLLPQEILRLGVLEPNVDAPRWLLVTGAMLVAIMVAVAVLAVVGRSVRGLDRDRAWFTLFLVVWMVGSVSLASASFAIAEVERYSARYFIFATVPIGPLVVVVVERVSASLTTLADRPRFRGAVSVLATAAITLVALAPMGLQGATTSTNDWRGLIGQIADAVESDPERRYAIFEAGTYGPTPRTQFYFDDHDLTVDGAITREEEATGEFRLLQDIDDLEQHHRLVVLFNHVRSARFPTLLDELESRYPVAYRQLPDRGRGYIVFDLES